MTAPENGRYQNQSGITLRQHPLIHLVVLTVHAQFFIHFLRGLVGFINV